MTTPDKLTACDVSDSYLESFGYMAEGIYCNVTGKRIGTIDTDEFLATIDMLNPTTANIEVVLDDYRLRLVASMRPSTRWNKFRNESLDELRKAQPIETLAYLLNRLFEPLNNLGSIWSIEQRIYVWQELQQINGPVTQVIHQLLEMDTRTGLNQLFVGYQRGMLLDFEAFAESIDVIYTAQQVKWAQLDAEYRYQIANPLAKQSFFNSFMENKPESVTKIKAKAKTERRRGFENLLAQILDEDSDKADGLVDQIEHDSKLNSERDEDRGVVAIAPSATPRTFTFGVKKD